MSEMEYIVADLQRRLANMIRRGKVHSVDFAQTPPRVRVEYAEGAITAWLPFISARQSVASASTWQPLAVGEGVMIFSESGDLALGIVLPSIPDATNTPPSNSPDEHITKYSDGTLIKYDRAAHALTVDVVGPVSLTASDSVDLVCKTAKVTASGQASITAAKIHLNDESGAGGAVTNQCVCAFTGQPHADVSKIVFIGKE